LARGFDGAGSLVLFLLAFVIASLVSYSMTILVFLPSLFILSRIRPMTGLTTSLLGLALGMTAWKSSGPNSGPPAESFPTFLLRWGFDPLTLIFLPAGLITVALYRWIGSRSNAEGSGPDSKAPTVARSPAKV
jgi:hypothetical protein